MSILAHSMWQVQKTHTNTLWGLSLTLCISQPLTLGEQKLTLINSMLMFKPSVKGNIVSTNTLRDIQSINKPAGLCIFLNCANLEILLHFDYLLYITIQKSFSLFKITPTFTAKKYPYIQLEYSWLFKEP